MPRQPGELRHRVTVQRATKAADVYGEMIETWATLREDWAGITPLSGQELIEAKRLEARTTHRVTMWHDPDSPITEGDRLIYNGRTLEIDSVRIVDEADTTLEIDATETKP